MPHSKPLISIVNVVATASIDQKLDLKDVTEKFPEVEWTPELFPGAVFRLKNPKTATLLFRSGKTMSRAFAALWHSVKNIFNPARHCLSVATCFFESTVEQTTWIHRAHYKR